MTKNDGFYHFDKMFDMGCTYNVAVGQRSNGKTYDIIDKAVEIFIKENIPSVYLRRWDEDLTIKNIFKLCDVHLPTLLHLSNGKYNKFMYTSRTFYMCYENEKGEIENKSDPFLYCYSLNTWEHRKGQDIGNIYYIIFDEFISRGKYIENEYEIFMNVLSSLIRFRDTAKIVMIANTVSKYCPYFDHFKIDIKKIKQGTISKFVYGQTTLALEYCSANNVTSKVNKKYFDFPNKKLDMIKRGVWEIDSYARLLNDVYKKCDKLNHIYINFSDVFLKWELLETNDNLISFIRPVTENEIENEHYIITSDVDYLTFNKYSYAIFPKSKIIDLLLNTYDAKKMFYSTDDVGDMFENFLKQMKY